MKVWLGQINNLIIFRCLFQHTVANRADGLTNTVICRPAEDPKLYVVFNWRWSCHYMLFLTRRGKHMVGREDHNMVGYH